VIQVLPESAAAESAGEAGPKPGLHGKVEKVSVSLPAELTAAVRARTGTGGFSRYVTDAVQERMRLDLLDDLSAELAAEFGPVDDELVRQAIAEWPDYQHE
jgi:Arc/MetJ-type ribon-helix-helix transcriptional regulator